MINKNVGNGVLLLIKLPTKQQKEQLINKNTEQIK